MGPEQKRAQRDTYRAEYRLAYEIMLEKRKQYQEKEEEITKLVERFSNLPAGMISTLWFRARLSRRARTLHKELAQLKQDIESL